MFSRLFNLYSRKEATKSTENCEIDLDDFQAEPSLPVLNRDKIRVLVFRECEKKSDKSLWFDSDAIILTDSLGATTDKSTKMCRPQVTTPRKSQENIFSTSPPKYKRIKQRSDVKMLGEMIFGSVTMVYKGAIQKVHLIRTPPQLLMTKVFALRSRSAGVNFCDNEMNTQGCSFASSSTSLNISTDVMNTSGSSFTSGRLMNRSYSNPIQSINTLQANRSMSSFVTTSPESLSQSNNSMNDSPPCGSLHRRYVRSKMTCMDSTEIWRTKSEQSEENRLAYKQQPKIGVGIIFKLWEDDEENNRLFQNFFFTHYALFESHLQTFRVKIEKSFYLRKNFIDAVLTATDCFKHDILTLCYSPRIIEPVWLNLMILAEQKHNETVEKFMTSFMDLIDKCETKQSNYFLSILLTAVLTHHPSWVATVMPSGNIAKRSYLDKHSSDKVDVLSKCHPYNPLWAQLCDMYGSVSLPRKLSRTVIVGENASLICELLYLLTYFIRCSDIKENELKIEPDFEHNSSSYRSSGSSWNDFIYNETGTPNSVRSWIDKVSCESTNDLVTDNLLKTELNKDDETVNKVSCDISNNEFIGEVIPDDINQCRCGYIQKVNSLGGKNLRNILKNTQTDRLKLNSKDTNINNNKSCKGCRTLEKTIFEHYCDECKRILNTLSLEMNSICSYCVVRLDTLLQLIHQSTNDTTVIDTCLHIPGICNNKLLHDESRTITDCQKLIKKEISSIASFQCYCCSQDTLHTDCTGEMDDTFITRERKASDPVDCVPSPKLTKCILRHSTTSHDSGTEMACSVTSSCPELDSADSLNLTRDNSVCSRDNLFSSDAIVADLYGSETIVTDMDSDYCSVENDQINNNDCDPLTTVCKSTSSTTIKEVYIDSSIVKVIETVDENDKSILDIELDSMNLKEIPLPRTIQRPVNRDSDTGINCRELTTFGSSLLAGYCDSYVSDFVIHGTEKLNDEKLGTDLQNAIKYSVLDEQVTDAACVVADTNSWSCEVWNLARRTDSIDHNTCESMTRKPVLASNLISSMIESTKELWDMKMPAKFCLLHLEEQLKDIYNRSKVLGEYAFANSKEATSSFVKSLRYHANDIELLKAVCVAHSPYCEEYLF